MNTGPHLDEDRLSALLDGEADPDEVQHADTCADCGARLAAWRDASRLVAANPPLASQAQRQAAVDAAIAAAASDESSGGRPVPMATRRRRRPAVAVPRIAAAAAAVIVVAGIGVAVSRSGGGGAGQASTAAKAAAKPPAVSTTQQPAASAAQPPGGTASSAAGRNPTGRLELGRYQDPAHLVAALQAQLTAPVPGAPSTFSLPTAETFQSCLGRAVTDAKLTAPTDPVLEATLDYQGSPAQVFVYTQAGRHVAVVVGVPKCALLADIPF